MSDLRNKAKEIFGGALDQSGDPQAFIDEACGDDAELRQRVRALLDAHERAGDFLAPSRHENTVIGDSDGSDPNEATASYRPVDPKPSEIIGPYKLLEEIGEGGMGTVWAAQQSEPIKRKVAIKLIKAGMDSKQVLARFEAERQALAMMDHPNIARVVDAGMTEQGRPYFAMEYVRGVPLTEYCDQARLSVKERLELFLPICNAVQHAHQKGIIHRDLKPSNILICLYDGKPVPKVIDFGLAKAMHHSLTDQSLHTAHGMMVGTPLYMSPEQAKQNNLDIDTRTDVYALGVILYELLTGSTPLEKAQMKEAAFNEILRLIKEVDPPKPSTRLSGSDSLPSVAAQRRIDPSHLTRSVTGDLDWVVMKALEKERTRRYETANGLAEDIRRHLSDEPVSASPPSTKYRMRKFIKRNRAGVIAASAIVVALLLGVIGTTSGMLWALSEKTAAVAARQAESDAKQEAIDSAALAKDEAIRATQAERLAKDEANRATAAEKQTADTLVQVAAERDAKELALKDAKDISKFLGDVFQSPDPTRDGREIKVVELLDAAAKKLETDLADQPAQRAKLQATLGNTYYALGLYSEAIPLQEQVRDYHFATSDPEHPDTLDAMNNLAISYHDAGRRDEALQLYEEVLTLRSKVSGPEHPVTLKVMGNLAYSYYAVGRRGEALQLQEEVLTLHRKVLGPEHPDTLTAMNNLALSYRDFGRRDEAIKVQKEVLTLRRKVSGPEHPNTLTAMGNLAASYHDAGRRDEALKLREEVLTLRRMVLGPEHPDTLNAMDYLARSYAATGRRDEALKLREEVLTLTRKVRGAKHPQTLIAMSGLARSYYSASRRDEALKLREEVLTLAPKVFGPEHPDTLIAMALLATSYHNAGRRDEAFKLQVEVLTLRREVLGPKHPHTLLAMNSLAGSYHAADRVTDALPLWAEYSISKPENTILAMKVASLQAWFEQDDEHTATSRRMLAWAADQNDIVVERVVKLTCLRPVKDAKMQEAALTLARRAVKLGQENNKTQPWLTMALGTALGMAEYRSGQHEQAATTLAAAITLSDPTKAFPTLIENTANFYLAMCLFQQGKPDEARSLFTATEAKMKPLPADEQNPKVNQDDLILWLAYKEAKALLQDPDP